MRQPLALLLIFFVLVLVVVVGLVAAIQFGLLKLPPADEADAKGPQPYRCCDRILSKAEAKLHAALTAAREPAGELIEREGHAQPAYLGGLAFLL